MIIIQVILLPPYYTRDTIHIDARSIANWPFKLYGTIGTGIYNSGINHLEPWPEVWYAHRDIFATISDAIYMYSNYIGNRECLCFNGHIREWWIGEQGINSFD